MSDPERPSAPPSRGALAFPVRALVLPVGALAALAVGGVAWGAGLGWEHWAWDAGLVLTGLPVVWKTLRGMFRGHFAADVVAMLAILTAFALHQPLAGLVIVLMQTGGELLDAWAEGRASDAVRALEAEAPHTAHRLDAEGHPHDVPAEQVAVGDRVLVRPGEMLPCDGVVHEGRSHLDVSRLTGEAPPERVEPGAEVRSGAVNLEGPPVVRATKVARESLYYRIVEANPTP